MCLSHQNRREVDTIMPNDRQLKCAEIARDWLAMEPLFLDTETTGLRSTDQIIQIAIVDAKGNTVLEALVKPTVPIGAEAAAVHGITEDVVARCPSFLEIWPVIGAILKDRHVVIYNAAYDTGMIRQSLGPQTPMLPGEMPEPEWNPPHVIVLKDGLVIKPVFPMLDPESDCVHDAMKLFAQFAGKPGKLGLFRWWKLGEAAEQCGIVPDGNLHGAAVDAETTRRIVEYMAKLNPPNGACENAQEVA